MCNARHRTCLKWSIFLSELFHFCFSLTFLKWCLYLFRGLIRPCLSIEKAPWPYLVMVRHMAACKASVSFILFLSICLNTSPQTPPPPQWHLALVQPLWRSPGMKLYIVAAVLVLFFVVEASCYCTASGCAQVTLNEMGYGFFCGYPLYWFPPWYCDYYILMSTFYRDCDSYEKYTGTSDYFIYVKKNFETISCAICLRLLSNGRHELKCTEDTHDNLKSMKGQYYYLCRGNDGSCGLTAGLVGCWSDVYNCKR